MLFGGSVLVFLLAQSTLLTSFVAWPKNPTGCDDSPLEDATESWLFVALWLDCGSQSVIGSNEKRRHCLTVKRLTVGFPASIVSLLMSSSTSMSSSNSSTTSWDGWLRVAAAIPPSVGSCRGLLPPN